MLFLMVRCYSLGFPLGSITSFESLPQNLTGAFPDHSLSHSIPLLTLWFFFLAPRHFVFLFIVTIPN